jgi:CO/xanthine dehydrogenase Mo-binding subunit
VRYVGEPIAIVAAEHPEQARRALEAIVVEYEALEPVVDMERALEQEPLTRTDPRWGHGYRDDLRPNVVRHMVIRHGDPETPGDVVVEGVYELGIQDQAFLGPESGLAVPDGEGGVDIHVATQWLHGRPRPGRPVPRPSRSSRCASTSRGWAAHSAAARTCPCRSTGRCWRSTRTAR